MTTQEFSNQFDVLYNNITSNQAPGLNEYEKSVFLTKAQDELVKNYFVPEGNIHQKGFDDSKKRQIDFSMLMSSASVKEKSTASATIDPRAYKFLLPKGVMFIINESLQFVEELVEDERPVVPGSPVSLALGTETPVEKVGKVCAIRQVIPLSFEEYTRLMSKPFKEPLKYQAWRLITGKQGNAPITEIIATTADRKEYSEKVPTYVIRYVRRPNPIILIDLKEADGTNIFGEDLTIDDVSDKTDCELDPSIHEEILQRAVELAKAAWTGDLNSTIEVGKRSE